MPTIKETEQILDFAVENPNDARSSTAMRKMGVTPEALGAWQAVRADPEHPKKKEVRNKMFDVISSNLPAKEPGRVEPGEIGAWNRIVVKNLLNDDPNEVQKFLKKKGFVTRIIDGDIEVKKPGQAQFSAIDPDKFDVFDLSDIAWDAIEAVATSAGFLAGPGGSAAAAGGAETLKQSIGMGLGVREEFNPGSVAKATAFGLAGGVVGKLGGKLLKGIGSLAGDVTSAIAIAKKKPDIEFIQAAAKRLNLKPTPGQLIDSKALQELEEVARNQRNLASTLSLRNQIENNIKIVDVIADDIVSGAAIASRTEVGEKVRDNIIKTVSERLEPAEEIYGALEASIKGMPAVNTKPIVDKILKLDKEFVGDAATRKMLKSQLNELLDIETISQLKTYRTTIRNSLEGTASNNQKHAIGEIYDAVTDARSQAIIDGYHMAENPEMAEFAAEQLIAADSIYKGVIDDIKVVLPRKAKIKRGPVKTLEDFFEGKPSSRLIHSVLKLDDPAKMRQIQERFPEAFDEMRTSVISDLAGKSKGARSLITNLNKLEPEAKLLLFGEEAAQKVDDLTTWLGSIADIRQVGNPSRTSFINKIGGFTKLDKIPIVKQIIDEIGGSSHALRRQLIANPILGNDIFTRTGKKLDTPKAVGAVTFGARQADNINNPPRFFQKNDIPSLGGR